MGNMQVKEVTNKQELNYFVSLAEGGQFLQSWEWGEFQKSIGKNIWRFGIYENNEILAVGTMIEHKLPLSRTYLYCPYGPVFKQNISTSQKEEIIKLFLSRSRDITIDTNTKLEIFLRLEPRLTIEELGNYFFNLNLKSTDAIQPRDTWVVDLKKSEADILKGMHQKTRYNIRLAEKKEVKVRVGASVKDFDIFWVLMQLTTKRDNFYSHHREYYYQLWNQFRFAKTSDQFELTIKLIIAEKDGVPLAAALFSFFGDRVVYLHGASSDQQKNIMAPYLLQWQAIKAAKEASYGLFDFYGIAPGNRKINKSDKESCWSGITRFKKGFGGREVNYVGAWDWVYNKTWYELYKLGRKIL